LRFEHLAALAELDLPLCLGERLEGSDCATVGIALKRFAKPVTGKLFEQRKLFVNKKM